jgi:hypothetical protein
MSLESSKLPPTTFVRIWSASVTQSGFGILKLRLSEHHTGERGCFLWRTQLAVDFSRGPAGEAGIMKRIGKGKNIRLQDQVNHPALFRTPDAGCSRGAQPKERFAESVKEGRLLTLNDQVAHLFPTPKSTDTDKGTRSLEGSLKEAERGHGIDPPSHVQIFPTPTIHGNYNRKGASQESGDGLETFVKLYPTPTCNDAKNSNAPSQRKENGRHSDALNVAAGGSLNPGWVSALMGFPPGWLDVDFEPKAKREHKGGLLRLPRLKKLKRLSGAGDTDGRTGSHG